MNRALELARAGLFTTHPNPRVGCVIVKDQVVVGEGYHIEAGGPHAEVFALRDAGSRANGATAYVTLEPCAHYGRTPPCCDALIDAGVTRVVVAMTDPFDQVDGEGVRRMRAAGIQVDTGLSEVQSEQLNRGFLSRVRRSRPWVRVKLAASVDGRTALANGESKWITGPEARRDVQRLRASASAILTGVGTVLADDPRLNVRLEDSPVSRQPVRVIVDSRFSIPGTARIFAIDGPIWVAGLHQYQPDDAPYDMIGLPECDGQVDLFALMSELADREINEVHVEAGERLCGSLLAAGLVDEIVLYLAPTALGSSARGLFAIPALESMRERINFNWRDVRQVGSDLRITLTPAST